MTRGQALALLQSLGMTQLMTQAKRTLDDTAAGYGPALDRAFAAYAQMKGLSAIPANTDAADDYGFQVVLRAATYDLVLPALASLVDASVDAPLTSAKFSQAFRAVQQLRDDAWAEAAIYGYGGRTGTDGFKVNLDFLEPCGFAAREYGD